MKSPRYKDAQSRPLSHFNDAILLAAARAGLPVLDLRQVSTAATDYANPIEPSDVGGQRIAEAIARMLSVHDFSAKRCQIYS